MINMISGSATAQNLWFPDSGSLYASPSSVQSSSFASTQPSPAMMALKPEVLWHLPYFSNFKIQDQDYIFAVCYSKYTNIRLPFVPNPESTKICTVSF